MSPDAASAAVLLDDPSGPGIRKLLDAARDDVLFLRDPRVPLELGERALARMAEVLAESDAGLVYADAAGRPRIDYQPGSIRDDFDFGPLLGLSTRAAREVCGAAGPPGDDLRWGGLYDLRLKLSERQRIVRVPEPLYTVSA